MRIVLSAILLNLFIFANLTAQPVLEWVRSIDGGANRSDIAEDIVTDKFGNIYATGMCRTQPNLINDLITVKYNSAGVEQWKTITLRDSNWSKHGYLIAVDSSGNVYSAVHQYTSGNTLIRLIVIKYDGASGNILWTKRHEQFIDDAEIHDMEIDISGNIILFIGGRVPGGLGDDAHIIKQNPVTGDTIWTRRTSALTSNLQDYVYNRSMATDAGGNIYISFAGGVGSSKWDCYTVKYDPAGVKLWERRYDNPGSFLDKPWTANVDSEGNVYIAGIGEFSSFYEREVFAIKYNPAGDSLWTKKFRGSYNKGFTLRDMELDNSGNMYISGSQYSDFDTQRTDVSIIKYSTAGSLAWVKHHRASGVSYSSGEIVVTSDSHIYAVSRAASDEIRVLKFTSAGTLLWESGYEVYPLQTTACGLALDNSNNIVVCAPISFSATGWDFTVIKYSQPIGISNISGEVPREFTLGQNYPNPFNPATNIEFSIPRTSSVKLTVYDITGKEIAVLVNKNLAAGTYRVDLDGGNFTSGVYFYKLAAENFTAVKKMITIK
jgi:hypothetical protein